MFKKLLRNRREKRIALRQYHKSVHELARINLEIRLAAIKADDQIEMIREIGMDKYPEGFLLISDYLNTRTQIELEDGNRILAIADVMDG